MKYLILLLLPVQFLSASGQEASRHFRYNFKTAAYVQFEQLPKETKVAEVTIIWHTVRDSRFLLLYLEEVSSGSDFEGGLIRENWDDTLLFDLNTNKVYMYNSKKCHQYVKRYYQMNREGRIVSADTLIECLQTLPEFATPTPTLLVRKGGVNIFKTKRFTFKYLDEVASTFDLQGYFERYRYFTFSPAKAPFNF